jgi:tetratricopeptide (TPR) repeat protein
VPTSRAKPERQSYWLTATLVSLALALGGVYAYKYLPLAGEEPLPLEPVASDTPAATVASAPVPAPAPDPAAAPEPEKTVETPAATPEPDPEIVRKAPSPLASRYVLGRQWTDCHESEAADVVADACKALIETGGLTTQDQATIRYKYARALRDKGDPDAAIASYDKSIDLRPTADAYNHRGVAYFDKGEYERAIDDYTEALRLNPTLAEAANNRAWTRYKAGDMDAALDDANRAIALDGSKSYIWDTRAHINEARGARSAAISDYRKALALDAGSESSREGLSRLGEAN